MNVFLLTMQYDERLLLPVFLRHYTQYLPKSNIFVIDHGSPVNLVPDGVNRLYVPRDRPFSEQSRKTLIQSIAHGLLRYYDLGVVADCDELIDLSGIENLGQAPNPATYVVGFDVYWEEGVTGRKLFGILNPDECKPLIFSRVPNWGLGFHNSEAVPGNLTIPLAHTRYLYGEESLERLRLRAPIHEAMDPKEQATGIAGHWKHGEEEYRKFRDLVERRKQLDTVVREFAPFNPATLFRAVASPNGSHAYYAEGDWSITDARFDLTKNFPALW